MGISGLHEGEEVAVGVALGEGAAMSRRLIGPCSQPGCGTPIYSRYMCEKHYRRWLRHADPSINLAPRNSPEKPCAFPGCGDVTTRTYCEAHEKRFRRYGSVEMAPPRGPRPYQGPCAELGCGNVATKTGRCARHSRHAAPSGRAARPMLSSADIGHIQANRTASAQQLAEQFLTTPTTVVAVQAGRNWGYRRP